MPEVGADCLPWYPFNIIAIDLGYFFYSCGVGPIHVILCYKLIDWLG